LNTRAAELNAYQDLIGQILDLNEALASNKELASINRKADEVPDSLTHEEFRQHSKIWMIALRHADLAYLQYERGLLNEQRVWNAMGIFRAFLSHEPGKELWQNSREGDNVSEDFKSYVNEMMGKRELGNPFWE